VADIIRFVVVCYAGQEIFVVGPFERFHEVLSRVVAGHHCVLTLAEVARYHLRQNRRI